MGFYYFGSVFEPFPDLTYTLWAETVFRFLRTMQRVTDTQPVDRKKVVLSEETVTEHGIIQIAEFNKNAGA